MPPLTTSSRMTTSPAARSGLRKSDVIVGVNRQAIANTAELRQLAGGGGDGLLLNLLRGREELLLVLR